MIQEMTNRELAQEINARIGNAPIPFDSVYSIALQIYQELGGEENDFDSVYSILLEILPLAEQVANKTSITEVDELPEPKDNNNIYRLSSDDKVYMSVRLSDTMTNRLSNEQQIDKGNIYNDGYIHYYKGNWKIILYNGEVDGYGWLETHPDSGEWYLYVTQEDAEHATGTTKMFYFSYDEAEGVDFDNHTVTYDDSIEAYQWEDADTIYSDGGYVIPAIYNAPEADCIGNASLNEGENAEHCIYTGELITFTYTGDEDTKTVTGYKWEDIDDSDYCVVTLKPASEMFGVANQSQYIIFNTEMYYVDISDPNPEEWYSDTIESFLNELYIPQLNAPDSEQVGKAYIEKNDTKFYYRGECNVQCTNGSKVLYWWCSTDEYTERNAFFSEEPANSIYKNSIWALNLADSHNSITYVNEHQFSSNGTTGDLEQDMESLSESLSCKTVNYTRVLNENWDWKQIATKDDIPQTTKIKLEDIGGTEMNKLNGFTETGVYNNVELQVKIGGDYYPGLLTVTVLHAYPSHPEKIDIWQEIRIFGYSDTYSVEDWVVQRVSLDGVWDAAQMMLLSHSAE